MDQEKWGVCDPPSGKKPISKVIAAGQTGNLSDVSDDIHTVMTKAKTISKENDRLKAKLTALESKNKELKSNPKSKKNRFNAIDAGIQVLVRDTIRDQIWRTVKFISSDQQVKMLTTLTLKKTGFSNKFEEDGKKLTKEGEEWVEEHSAFCLSQLCILRSYCQNLMKDTCIQWMKDNKVNELPSLEELMKIIRRDPDCDKELFVWYWDVFIEKCTASAKVWNEKIKHFGLISTHAPPNAPGNVYITPSTEAFGVLVMENCRTRWPKLMEVKGTSSKPIRYYSGDVAPKSAGKEYVNVKTDPEYMGKYTKVDAGNKKFGGWTQEGLLLYKNLVKDNKIGRAKDTTTKLEKEILDMIRKKHNVQGNTYEEYQQHLKGDKPEAVELQEVEGLIDMDDFDDIVQV